MEVYTTEEQQVEAIKKWWRENRWSIIGGVAIGIAAILGWRGWQESQQAYSESASLVYENMMLQLQLGNQDKAADSGSQLLGEFSDTPYADLAALAMARINLEKGDLAAAESQLRWILDNSSQQPALHEARLRLGALLLAAGRHDDALGLMEGIDFENYASAYHGLRGDIYVAQNNIKAARQAYSQALSEINPGSPSRQILQMKLDDLGSDTMPQQNPAGSDS